MRSLSLLLTLCTLAATTLAAVRPLLPIQKHEGPTTGRLIFRLRDGAPKTEIIRQAAQGGEVTHDWDIINGFAGMYKLSSMKVGCCAQHSLVIRQS